MNKNYLNFLPKVFGMTPKQTGTLDGPSRSLLSFVAVAFFALMLLIGNEANAQKRLLWAHMSGSGLNPGNLLNSSAVSQGWTSTSTIIGAPSITSTPTTLTAISGQTMGGQTLTKANFDAVIFGTVYAIIDPTYITALINFMNEGGIVYFMTDGAYSGVVATDLKYQAQENQLIAAATGLSSSMTDVVEEASYSNVPQVPYSNIGGVQTAVTTCLTPTDNTYQTGNYIDVASIPDNVLYYTYDTSVKANLLFTKTVMGGVLGISTEFFSGGSSSTSASAVDAIYNNVFSSQLKTGICALPYASLSKSVSPATIPDGGTATYTFTISNTGSGAVAQTGIKFIDNLPTGLKLAAIPNAVITGGSGGSVTAVAGGTSITLSGLSLAAAQTATVTVNVTNVPGQTNASCGANPAAFTNSATNISYLSTNVTNNVGNVCLLVTVTAAGTVDCSKTQIFPAPVQGTASQNTLVLTVNITSLGAFTPTVSGSGMSLAMPGFTITPTATGIQTFHIPIKYDGTTLGTMTFGVAPATPTCTADLTKTPKGVITNIWTLDCLPTVGPTFK